MEDVVRRYYDKKIRCPICNRKVAETFLTPPTHIPNREYVDRVNKVICNECGWQGVVDQLRG
jgi:uncharacterized protein with PIN domain